MTARATVRCPKCGTEIPAPPSAALKWQRKNLRRGLCCQCGKRPRAKRQDGKGKALRCRTCLENSHQKPPKESIPTWKEE